MAAALAMGPAAVLSHRSAAELWGIRPTARRRVDVTVRGRPPHRPGIRVHHSLLQPDEITTRDGIPVTTVPRTLLDLAAILNRRQLERALNEAEVLRLWDARSVADLLGRRPGARGAAAMRAVLAAREEGATVTRSELEERFLALMDAAGLPKPAVNDLLKVGDRWIEADCVWREQRLVVELDGHAAHATRTAFDRDRARDRALQAAGWRVVRVTWRQLSEDPAAVVADLRVLAASLPRR